MRVKQLVKHFLYCSSIDKFPFLVYIAREPEPEPK